MQINTLNAYISLIIILINDNFIHVLCMYRCKSFYIHNVIVVRPLEGDFYF